MKQRDISVIAAALVTNLKKDSILLIRRKDLLWGSAWSIPGGHVETGEKIVEALYRELKEELNLKILSFYFLEYEELMPKKKHMISFNFVVIADNQFKIQEKEISDAKWIKINGINNINHKLSKNMLKEISNWREK